MKTKTEVDAAMEDVTERTRTELSLRKRRKELDCLYNLTTLCSELNISQEELLMKSALCIPPGFQFPEIAEACIEIEDTSFQTPGFRETPWMLAVDILVQGIPVGQLTVCYLEERPAPDAWPFLSEELQLLTAIAEKLDPAISRRQVATELQKSNDRFNQLAEKNGIVAWEVDPDGLYTYVSHVSESVLGYRPDELVGRMHFYDLHPEAGREAFKNSALALFEGKEPFDSFEHRAQKKDGGLMWFSTHGYPLLRADGTLFCYRGCDTDITKMKIVMEQLLHAQKMESVGQLAGGLAHDLNNILTVINGYAALVQRHLAKDHKHFEYLEEVIQASNRAASLTRSLLAYSRKQTMNRQIKDLNPLLTTISSFIERIIHENITFTLSLQNAPLNANVDTVQLEQVLLNFATNARDAMPDGGTLTISAVAGSIDRQFITTHGYGAVGRYAIITVTDSGAGMDAETKGTVFDPFFTTKEVGKGTGLGLSMVMGIIKAHDGFIDLQSEPGCGCVFQVYLPLVDSAEEDSDAPEQHSFEERASGTILLAEDDEATRNAVAEFLTRAGYTVITAVDGQDAIDKFAARENEIELVISDVVMPRKSGKAVGEEIRRMSDSVQFIFVSGHASDIIWREGGFGPDVEIIEKPILPFELLQKIKSIMPSVSSPL